METVKELLARLINSSMDPDKEKVRGLESWRSHKRASRKKSLKSRPSGA